MAAAAAIAEVQSDTLKQLISIKFVESGDKCAKLTSKRRNMVPANALHEECAIV